MENFKINNFVLELIDSQIKESGKFDVEIEHNGCQIYLEGSGTCKYWKEEMGCFDDEVFVDNIEIEVYKNGEEIELTEELEKAIHSQLPRL